eukprot:m.201669 g.201669  ORF g.201669 m.201669 type:complete len:174 (+) comp39600_c0_seq33:1912-2433(+)
MAAGCLWLVLVIRDAIFANFHVLSLLRLKFIGREMYIINHGKVECIIRHKETNEREVVRTLKEGNYFGEISLLKLDGGCNKRTADIRSVGYSELFILSKKDLLQALHYYPEAKEILEKLGRERAALQILKTEALGLLFHVFLNLSKKFLNLFARLPPIPVARIPSRPTLNCST